VADVTRESIDLGLETLQRMADLITEGAKVEAETHRDHLTLKITGGNAGILIGRKGQTLDAMQFLTDKIINRKSEARVLVKVDVEGYIETRKSNLKHLAVKMAEKAKKTGKPATINQMSAQDRRIVHLTLKDDNRVRTQSMGDGYYRRLVIFPKKKNSYAGKKRFKR
jgi:spoIIIJ-associated protein